MANSTQQTNEERAAHRGPGPARLFTLLAGVGLALLGVVGFFYDSSFGTGDSLTSDDLAGILNVNGWRNVLYFATGCIALAVGPRVPRLTALVLGAFYLALGLWGLAETERDIGSILDALPLGNDDNALHLVLGGLGLIAALVDGPLPSLPKRHKRPDQPRRRQPAEDSEEPGPRSGDAVRRPRRAGLRGAGDGEPR